MNKNKFKNIIKDLLIIWLAFFYKIYIQWVQVWWIIFLLILHYATLNAMNAELLPMGVWIWWFILYGLIWEKYKFKSFFIFLWLAFFIMNYMFSGNILFFHHIGFGIFTYSSLFLLPILIYFYYQNQLFINKILKNIINKILWFLKIIAPIIIWILILWGLLFDSIYEIYLRNNF